MGWGVHTYADQPHTFVRRASGGRCGRYGAASSHGCSGQRPPPPSHSGVPVSSDGAAVFLKLNPIKAWRGHGGKFPRILDVACAFRSRTRHPRRSLHHQHLHTCNSEGTGFMYRYQHRLCVLIGGCAHALHTNTCTYLRFRRNQLSPSSGYDSFSGR